MDAIRAQVKPAEPEHGDLAFPTFPLAKQLRTAPPKIAADLAGRLSVPGLEIAAAGPYVNARFEPRAFMGGVLAEVRGAGIGYGSTDAGRGKTVVIDYSSPNIAKPIGFHHIRTTLIGHAIANLYRSQGWRVEGINYLGDWGKQFGLVAVGLREYGDPARRGEMGHLVDVYVKANARAEAGPRVRRRGPRLLPPDGGGRPRGPGAVDRAPRDLAPGLPPHLRAAGHPLRAHRRGEPLPGPDGAGHRGDRAAPWASRRAMAR